MDRILPAFDPIDPISVQGSNDLRTIIQGYRKSIIRLGVSAFSFLTIVLFVMLLVYFYDLGNWGSND